MNGCSIYDHDYAYDGCGGDGGSTRRALLPLCYLAELLDLPSLHRCKACAGTPALLFLLL